MVHDHRATGNVFADAEIPRVCLGDSPSVLVVVFARIALAGDTPAAAPENLAPRTTITASSTFSDQYVGKLVADGVVPAAMSCADIGRAWCAQGNNHPNGVTLTFTWPEPVAVAELVYFGRTAWQWEENWKNYEVYIESAEKPVTAGELQQGHGPQRIALPETCRPSSLTLKFLSSYGGSNPGASEIQVFAAPLPDAAYAAFTPPVRTAAPAPPPIVESNLPESAELAGQLAQGALGFTQLIVVQRQSDRSHTRLHVSRGGTETRRRSVCGRPDRYSASADSVGRRVGRPDSRCECVVRREDGLVQLEEDACRTSSSCSRSTWTARTCSS